MTESPPTLSPAPVGPDQPQANSSHRVRVLLVEGDGFTRVVLLLRLRLAGFGVDFTSNGILGLGKLRSCHPDVLLLDLKLCGLSGLELIKAARADELFGQRPIYVFTHVDRMSRAVRKEVGLLATRVLDKRTVSREDVVRLLSTNFLEPEAANQPASASTDPKPRAGKPGQVVLPEEIAEIIAGVREQAELLAQGAGPRATIGRELLSRVSSLRSCAEAAELYNLARYSKALESLLAELCKKPQGYGETALNAIARSVELMSAMCAGAERKNEAGELVRFSTVATDESASSLKAMEKSLSEAGFDPICFENPSQARDYLAANRTELVIANLRLPEAHGLALADVRQLAPNSATPVLFGPENTGEEPHGEELPTSAPRLDAEALLLAELIVRALNEVQAPRGKVPARAAAAPPSPVGISPQFSTPPPAASLAFDDGFELFSASPRSEEAPALRAAAEIPCLAEETVERPLGWVASSMPNGGPFDEGLLQSPAAPELAPNHLFSATGLPAAAPTPVEPEAPNPDQEAEFLARLEATPIIGSQTEERTMEALPRASEQSAGLPPPAPEVMGEDHTAPPTLFAAAASEGAQPQPPANPLSPTEAEAVLVAESAATPANYEEAMNNPIQAVSPEYGEQTAEARCAELEQELATLRQAFEGFNGSFGQQQQAVLEAGQQLQELEQRLSQSAQELQQQREEQAQIEAELHRQLQAATAAKQQSEAAQAQAEARCAQLEKDLAAKAADRPKATGETGASLHAAPAAGAVAPALELEQQVRQGVAALARATAELAKERGERQRIEQRAAEMNGRLQALHTDLKQSLQVQKEDQTRLSALEEQERQTRQALEQRTAELEQQQAEHRLAQEELQTAKEANAQLRKDLSFFEGANKLSGGARQELQDRLESSLSAARESEARLQQEQAERQRLAASLQTVQREAENQSRRREALEKELQASQEALKDREAKLQQETAERQRLKDSLDSFQRNLRDGSERDLEVAKLQSAFQQEQLERKRQESQLARMRRSAVDAAHAARALRTSLRRQIREPVDNLAHSVGRLLELETGEEQRKLAEAALQDVLLVQTRLREPEPAHPAHAEPPDSPNGSLA